MQSHPCSPATASPSSERVNGDTNSLRGSGPAQVLKKQSGPNVQLPSSWTFMWAMGMTSRYVTSNWKIRVRAELQAKLHQKSSLITVDREWFPVHKHSACIVFNIIAAASQSEAGNREAGDRVDRGGGQTFDLATDSSDTVASRLADGFCRRRRQWPARRGLPARPEAVPCLGIGKAHSGH